MTDRTPQRQRERALFVYRNALERGDFDTVARILHMAEMDAILDQMIAELHEAALEPLDERPAPPDAQQHVKSRGIQINITFRNRLSPDGRPPKTEPDEEDNSMNAVYQPVNQRAQQYLTLAAALLIFVLLGGVVLNMIPNPFFRPLTPRHTPALAVITPENAAQIQQIGFLGRGQIHDAAWSPDNRTLALASSSGIIWLYNPGDLNAEPGRLPGHSGGVFKLAFSGDGKTLASVGADKTIRIWDMNTDTERLHIEDQDAITLAITQDGKRVAISNRLYREIRIWDTESGSEIATIGPFERSMSALAFSPDGNIMVAANPDKLIYILDVQDRSRLATLPGHEDVINSIAFNPDGSMFASGDLDGVIRLWNWNGAAGSLGIVLHGHENNIDELAFSRDGKTLASGSVDGVVRLWNLDEGGEQAVLTGHTDRVTGLTFSPDSKTLLSVGFDETLRLWDAATGTQVNHIAVARGHSQPPVFALFSPNGTTIASAGYDGQIIVWDTASRTVRYKVKTRNSIVWGLAFSADGRLLGSNGDSGSIQIWDAATGVEQAAYRAPFGISVAFNPDATLIASSHGDSTARIWNLVTGEETEVLQGSVTGASWVAFTPDGKMLAFTSGDLRLWDIESGQERLVLTPAFQGLRISADGATVVASDQSGNIHLWDIATGAERAVLHGHTDQVLFTAFSPDGTMLLSAGGNVEAQTTSVDPTMRLWNLATGQPIRIFSDHTATLNSAMFSPDGTMLLSSSEDGTIRLWGVPTSD